MYYIKLKLVSRGKRFMLGLLGYGGMGGEWERVKDEERVGGRGEDGGGGEGGERERRGGWRRGGRGEDGGGDGGGGGRERVKIYSVYV